MKHIQFGLMMRAQFPAEDDMRLRFDELLEQARLADQLGYASITTGMHYASAPLQLLQQLPFLTRIMVEAPHARLNFGAVILPLHKPLDLAENLATVDVMSGGRVIFSAGLGYREVESRAFGTTQADRVQRYEENIEAVRRLWTEDHVSMTASHFELVDVTASVKPLQKPHPPIWIAANADVAIRRAARLGDCWYVNPHNSISTIQRQVEVYRRALDKLGKPFPTEFPARREVFVARTREEARRLCEPFLATKYEVYRQWGQDRAMPAGDGFSADFDELVRDRFLVGSPEEVAGQIVRLQRETGINHIIASLHWPGMPQSMVLEVLHLVAEEVMPLVRSA